MKTKKYQIYRRWLPYLHLYITIPFFSVRTAVMYEALDSMSIEYMLLHITVHKWNFEVRLYDTMRSRECK